MSSWRLHAHACSSMTFPSRIADITPRHPASSLGRHRERSPADRTATSRQHRQARVGDRWDGKRDVSEPRPITSAGNPLSHRRVRENLQRRTAVAVTGQAEMDSLQGCAGNTRARLERRTGEVPLWRKHGASEHLLIEGGQRAPVPRNEVRVHVRRALDHARPSILSRRARHGFQHVGRSLKILCADKHAHTTECRRVSWIDAQSVLVWNRRFDAASVEDGFDDSASCSQLQRQVPSSHPS